MLHDYFVASFSLYITSASPTSFQLSFHHSSTTLVGWATYAYFLQQPPFIVINIYNTCWTLCARWIWRCAYCDAESALKDNPDDITDEERQGFWTLQRSLNSVTSSPPDYAISCAGLDLNPDEPLLLDGKLYKAKASARSNTPPSLLRLYPHQVIGCYWLRLMEQSHLQ